MRIIKQSDLNAIAAAAGVAQQPTGSTAATAAGDAKATDSTAPDASAGQKASNGEIWFDEILFGLCVVWAVGYPTFGLTSIAPGFIFYIYFNYTKLHNGR